VGLLRGTLPPLLGSRHGLLGVGRSDWLAAVTCRSIRGYEVAVTSAQSILGNLLTRGGCGLEPTNRSTDRPAAKLDSILPQSTAVSARNYRGNYSDRPLSHRNLHAKFMLPSSISVSCNERLSVSQWRIQRVSFSFG